MFQGYFLMFKQLSLILNLGVLTCSPDRDYYFKQNKKYLETRLLKCKFVGQNNLRNYLRLISHKQWCDSRCVYNICFTANISTSQKWRWQLTLLFSWKWTNCPTMHCWHSTILDTYWLSVLQRVISLVFVVKPILMS